jgi:hypothetical protein
MGQTEPSGSEPPLRPWARPPPGRLVGRGHPAIFALTTMREVDLSRTLGDA